MPATDHTFGHQMTTTTTSKRNRTIAAAATGTVALIGAVWIGGGVYAGKTAEAELRRLVAESMASKSYRLTNLNHRGGFLGTDGSSDLSLIDECEDPGAAPYFSAKINYQFSNLIMPTSLARFEWTVEATGEAKAAFEKLFGGEAKLEGKGTVGFTGHLRSDMDLPEMKWANSGALVKVSSSTGVIDSGKDTLALDWTTSKISMRGNGEAFEAEGLGMQMDLTSVKRGLGSFSLSLDKLATGMGSAEGMMFASEVIAKGDRIDMTMTPSVKSISGGGKNLKDLVVQIAINGLHAGSIEHLIALSQSSCNFRNLTQDEQKQMRASVQTLLFGGFSAGIQKISGTVDGDSLDGKLMVELTKTGGTTFRLEEALRSSGSLILKGKNLDPDSKKTLVSLGFATETPEGLRAEFSYADGILKVNGKAMDATVMTAAAAGMNDGINAFLAGKPLVALHMPEPPVEAIPEVAPDEPAPAAEAPAQEES